jgi:hypothetical protein
MEDFWGGLIAKLVRLDPLEIGFGFVELGEETLFGLKFAGVDAATSSFDADGVLEVKHLVVEKVLDGATGGIGAIEDAADDDGVVGRIVVAQHAAGVVGAPRKCGAAEKTVEEAGVERLEDLVEIVVMADGSEDALAAAGLADVFRLAGDSLGGDVTAVAVGVGRCDWLFIKLGEQDVGYGSVDGFGRVLEDVGETDVEPAFAKTDGGIKAGETVKANVERRNGCAGSEVPVLLFKNGDECRGHYSLRLARWLVGCRAVQDVVFSKGSISPV